MRTPLSETVELTIEGNYLQQGPYTETVGGAMVSYNLTGMMNEQQNGMSQLSVGAGIFMRVNDALIPYVQMTYNHFDVGLSYDVNISSLKTATQGQGGFELSLTYRAFTKNQNSSLQGVRCPRF